MTIKGFGILVSAIAVSLFASASAVAQPMPVDSLIIKGTLDNGMTYYIRHNANPKGYADRCFPGSSKSGWFGAFS